MLLKRQFVETVAGLEPSPLIEVKHTGTTAEQNFSHRLVAAGIAEGWLSLGRGVLTLHTPGEDLAYAILRGPGRYCLHCGHKMLDDGDLGEKMRAHVAAAHRGATSPDSRTPAGYVWLTHYECRLNPAQHEKYKAVVRRG